MAEVSLTKRNSFGIGTLNRRAYNQPIEKQILVIPNDVNKNGEAIIKVWNRNEHLLDAYYPTIQENSINSVKYDYDEAGSGSCTLQLLEKSKIGFASYGLVTIDQKERRYKGFIYEFPDEGSNEKEIYTYKIKGLRERLNSVTIEVKEKFDISSISILGTDATYTISGTLDFNPIGRMLVSQNCTDKRNNRNSIVISYTSDTITVYSPTGVVQSTSQGELRILPYEWSISTKISDVFKELILDYALLFSNGIGYNPDKIDNSTGFRTQGWIDLDKLTLDKVFDAFRKMVAGAFILGVDQDGEYYFKKIQDDPIDYLYIGYDVHEPKIKGKPGDIYNRITVLRKGGSQDNRGLKVAAIGLPLSDANTSAAKYGDRYKQITVPAFFSDEAMQLIADNGLQKSKDLKYTVAVNNLSEDKFYPIGTYQVITPPVERKLILSEHDTLDGWVIDPEITASINTAFLVTGSGSSKYVLDSACNGKSVRLAIDIFLASKKYLYLWARSSKIGNVMDVTISDGVNSFTNEIYFDTANNYQLLEWDISSLSIQRITEVSYTFKNITDSATIYCDELAVKIFGSIRYNVPLQKATINKQGRSTDIDLQFGEEFDKLTDYLLGLQALGENSILAHKG